MINGLAEHFTFSLLNAIILKLFQHRCVDVCVEIICWF